MVAKFPAVEMADETGLLAIGGDLEVATLELAYRNGIFPWPIDEQPILWFAPPKRAIIEFNQFRISRRLQRYLRKADFEFRFNTDFKGVIQACAHSKNRKGQHGTWITESMIQAYIEFHTCGYAHSFEAFNHQDELIAGLYGVLIGKYFAGESMFHKIPHASKFVLIQTVQFLQNRGLKWMDVQILSPFLKHFGAIEIPREQFMMKLKQAIG
ncbi:MAG: leucyl/phenylalanyl-tRNA--protein transferase [bacterium]